MSGYSPEVIHGWIIGIGFGNPKEETGLEIEFTTTPPYGVESGAWEQATLIRRNWGDPTSNSPPKEEHAKSERHISGSSSESG